MEFVCSLAPPPRCVFSSLLESDLVEVDGTAEADIQRDATGRMRRRILNAPTRSESCRTIITPWGIFQNFSAMAGESSGCRETSLPDSAWRQLLSAVTPYLTNYLRLFAGSGRGSHGGDIGFRRHQTGWKRHSEMTPIRARSMEPGKAGRFSSCGSFVYGHLTQLPPNSIS